jgi:predicted nuclease of restriction endonuclease-like RecB superfamily
MLTKAHRVYRWIKPGSSISSDRLEDDCLPRLERAIAIYRARLGDTLGRVRNAARLALEGLRPDRVEAVVELLDDAATYEWPPGRAQAERRLKLFEMAAREHPMLDPVRAGDLLGQVLDPPLQSHDEAVAQLYADYPEFHRLTAFPADYTAEDLRADYDLGQAQALLYSAVSITVEARADFKHILQYARLSRLLCRIQRLSSGEGYGLAFDGPNSVLRHTHAYGVNFARFLAALVQARDWRLTAHITLRKNWRPVVFTLSEADGLRSRVPAPSLFDSALEERFARKFGAERDGWRLRREAAILEAGGAHIVPDFLFTHADGTEVALEIVGYWTPEYLREKFDKLARVTAPNLIVAVRKALALRPGSLPATVLPFSSGIRLRDLLPRLDAFRERKKLRRD